VTRRKINCPKKPGNGEIFEVIPVLWQGKCNGKKPLNRHSVVKIYVDLLFFSIFGETSVLTS